MKKVGSRSFQLFDYHSAKENVQSCLSQTKLNKGGLIRLVKVKSGSDL